MIAPGRLIGASLLVGLFGPSVRAQEFRTLDGTGNHPSRFQMGVQGETLARLTAPDYSDGIGAVDTAVPIPEPSGAG